MRGGGASQPRRKNARSKSKPKARNVRWHLWFKGKREIEPAREEEKNKKLKPKTRETSGVRRIFFCVRRERAKAKAEVRSRHLNQDRQGGMMLERGREGGGR